MDFLDPKKRKAHRIKLFIGYSLMAIALTFTSVILLYQSYGYDYDRETGQIVQNGLVFIDAHPDGADVALNGEPKGRTGLRLDVRADDYTLELKQPGYHTWTRNFTLEAGSIERFVYPFLFPEELRTSDTQAYTSSPGLVTQSPNRELLLVQQPGSFQRFDLISIAGDTAETTTINLPASLLTASGNTHVLTMVEWSSDNRHVLLSHQHDAGLEFVVLDTDSPSASVNVTKTFSDLSFASMQLHDKKFDQYYLFDSAAGRLWTAQLEDQQTQLYQEGVLAYRPHGDDEVALITAAGADTGKVWLNMREGSETYNIRQLPVGSRYLLDIARFDDSWYLVGGTAEENKAYILRNPVSAIKRDEHELPLPIAVLRTPAAPEFISFSANTRFIAMQSGNDFAVYDAETDRQYRYNAGLGLTAPQQLSWMDGHRLTAVINGQTMVMDYDGTNKQQLTAAFNGYLPFFDNDYEALFTVSASVTGNGLPALVRTELRVND